MNTSKRLLCPLPSLILGDPHPVGAEWRVALKESQPVPLCRLNKTTVTAEKQRVASLKQPKRAA